MWRLHSFLRALHEDHQDHIITLLGHEPEKYNEVSLSFNLCPSKGRKVRSPADSPMLYVFLNKSAIYEGIQTKTHFRPQLLKYGSQQMLTFRFLVHQFSIVVFQIYIIKCIFCLKKLIRILYTSEKP